MGRHQTGMADVERQEVLGAQEILEKRWKAERDCCISCVAGILIVVLTLCIVVPLALLHVDVQYYVAIDSVSGGGHDTPTGGALSFNLTLGVSSSSYGAKACIKPGTYVQVSYRGVELAISEAETGWLCVPPRKSAEQHVIAIGSVPEEGQVLDSLAADMKQGAAVFDVALHLPAGSYGKSKMYHGENCVSECGSMRVGAATAWCDAPDQMP